MRFAAFVLLALPAAASQIHVPGDFPNVQAAIDAAVPGELILVAGGTHDPVVIDKGLTILGDPSFDISSGCAFDPTCGTCPPDANAFRLAGSGGRVTLGGFSVTSMDCNYPAPAIGGGGFDELHVYDATITIRAGLSGLGHGASAIDVDVPFVLVSGSSVAAAGSDSDHCAGFLHDDVVAGIRNPSGAVLLVDTSVVGGNGGMLCCVYCLCPSLPDPSFGGAGGDGVVANEVFLAGATVTAGIGSTYLNYPFGDPYYPAGTPTICGSQPNGTDIVASAMHVLADGLSAPSKVVPGSPYPLSWDLPGPSAFLFFALGVGPPVPSGGGFVFLDASTLSFFSEITTGGPQTFAPTLPAFSGLLGLEFAFQAWDATLGLTRPTVAVIAP